MRKWCSRVVPAALLCATVACGPRTVPLPARGTPVAAAAGQTARPAAGSLAYAGAGTSATGAGRAAAPSAGTGSVRPPIPVAATSGSGLPVAGSSGTQTGGLAGSPLPAAGNGEPVNPTGAPFDAGNDPARNNVPPGGLCARLAVIQCAAEAHCCFAPTRSTAACRTASENTCRNDLYVDQISQNPITGFDAAFAAQVFEELEARSSRCDLEIASWTLSPQGLRGIWKGTLEANANCKPPATALMDKPTQAASLVSCKNITSNVCTPRSLLGEWTCAAKGAVGTNCVTSDNCQNGLFCKNPQMANPLGKCAERVALGASCSTGDDCQSLFCKGGSCVAPEQQLAFCGE